MHSESQLETREVGQQMMTRLARGVPAQLCVPALQQRPQQRDPLQRLPAPGASIASHLPSVIARTSASFTS